MEVRYHKWKSVIAAKRMNKLYHDPCINKLQKGSKNKSTFLCTSGKRSKFQFYDINHGIKWITTSNSVLSTLLLTLQSLYKGCTSIFVRYKLIKRWHHDLNTCFIYYNNSFSPKTCVNIIEKYIGGFLAEAKKKKSPGDVFSTYLSLGGKSYLVHVLVEVSK